LFLKTLVHKNYRGLIDATVDFGNVNHIIGNNGAGKTSIIEAITILLNGRSFQGATLKSLSNNSTSFFRLAGIVEHSKTSSDELLLVFDDGKKAHTLNNKRLGQQEAHKTFPLCLIDTNVIQVSSGQPSYRRDLLDRAVFHVEPQHVVNHKKLNKCLSQRNRSIVKGENIRTIQSWDEMLADLGEKINKARTKLISEAEGHVLNVSKELLGEGLKIRYIKGWEGETYLKNLKENINKDIAMKRTSSGPQKDDFKLMSQENKTKGYYSHGQEKMASISFMVALNLAVEKRKKNKSIIIIDEAESGLDEGSIEKVIKIIKSLNNQLLITSLPHHKIVKKINGNILNAIQK